MEIYAIHALFFRKYATKCPQVIERLVNQHVQIKPALKPCATCRLAGSDTGRDHRLPAFLVLFQPPELNIRHRCTAGCPNLDAGSRAVRAISLRPAASPSNHRFYGSPPESWSFGGLTLMRLHGFDQRLLCASVIKPCARPMMNGKCLRRIVSAQYTISVGLLLLVYRDFHIGKNFRVGHVQHGIENLRCHYSYVLILVACQRVSQHKWAGRIQNVYFTPVVTRAARARPCRP